MEEAEKRAKQMPLWQRKQELAAMAEAQVQACKAAVSAQPHRTGYHLMPPVGWLNDPNGLCFYRGNYHVFFQYAPFSTDGGLKLWGHYSGASLTDLSWQGVAVVPDESYDRDGAYSGSAIEKDGTLYLFYTGNVKEEGQHDYVLSGRGANVVRMESTDGIHFSGKQCLLDNAAYPKACTNHVRDPKVYFGEDGRYHMVLGARLKEEKGAVLLYSSEDLEHFRFDGQYSTKEPFGYMWECPDIFRLGEHRVLSVCPQGLAQEADRYQNVYQAGYFLEGAENFTEWDMGFDFYAPQTFLAPDGRRILIGWAGVPDAGYDSNPCKEGWQHCLTVPRTLTMRDGKILQYPVQELETLRRQRMPLGKDGEMLFAEGCGEVLLEGIQSGCFSIYIGQGCVLKSEQGRITLTFTDESGAGRSVRNAVAACVDSVRILLDVSVFEIYINRGEVVMTSRIFLPERALAVRLEVEAQRAEGFCLRKC